MQFWALTAPGGVSNGPRQAAKPSNGEILSCGLLKVAGAAVLLLAGRCCEQSRSYGPVAVQSTAHTAWKHEPPILASTKHYAALYLDSCVGNAVLCATIEHDLLRKQPPPNREML